MDPFDSSSSQDITISSTPTTLLTINFTTSNTLGMGTYDFDIDVPNTDLTTDSPTPGNFGYTPENASFTVQGVPEPPIVELFLMGLPMIIGLFFLKRFHSREAREV